MVTRTQSSPQQGYELPFKDQPNLPSSWLKPIKVQVKKVCGNIGIPKRYRKFRYLVKKTLGKKGIGNLGKW